MTKRQIPRLRLYLGQTKLQTLLLIQDGKGGYFVKPKGTRVHVHSYTTDDPERFRSVVAHEKYRPPNKRRHTQRKEFTPQPFVNLVLGLFAAENSPPPSFSSMSDFKQIDPWFNRRKLEIV